MATELPVIVIDGVERKLATLLPEPGLKLSMPVFAVPEMSDSALEKIARTGKLDGRTLFEDRNWIKDQGAAGSCNGWAGAMALARARVRGGQDRVDLSGSYLYSLVNDGRDEGSTLHRGMAALMDRGCASEPTVRPHQIYRNQYDVQQADREAQLYRAHECYAVETVRGAFTAVAMGFDVVLAVHVGDSFSKLDRNGFAGIDNGAGNHAVLADGLAWADGELAFTMANSWGVRWGSSGRALLRADHLARTIRFHKAYAIRAAKQAQPLPKVKR